MTSNFSDSHAKQFSPHFRGALEITAGSCSQKLGPLLLAENKLLPSSLLPPLISLPP